uniref:Transmembrane protein n=1 Tax=Schizaphis graminum TaxID=13262 RepID=A0A2S2PLH7_SCHGA
MGQNLFIATIMLSFIQWRNCGGGNCPPEMFVVRQKYHFAPPTNNPHLKSVLNINNNIKIFFSSNYFIKVYIYFRFLLLNNIIMLKYIVSVTVIAIIALFVTIIIHDSRTRYYLEIEITGTCGRLPNGRLVLDQ